jgi:hypothetical protein
MTVWVTVGQDSQMEHPLTCAQLHNSCHLNHVADQFLIYICCHLWQMAIKFKYHGIVSAQNSVSFSSLESQLYNDVVQIYYDSSDDWRRYNQE